MTEQKRAGGDLYCEDYLEYIFLDEFGHIVKPNTVSQSFNALLMQKGLRHIRFHDLRHSCASLLLDNGVDLKKIQEWLGHSSVETTSRFYAHLSYESKIESANVISNSLSISR